jgi:hypothetical protein
LIKNNWFGPLSKNKILMKKMKSYEKIFVCGNNLSNDKILMKKLIKNNLFEQEI